MMGHSRVAFGDVKGKTSIPFLDTLPLSLSLSELSLSFHRQVYIKIASLRLHGTLSMAHSIAFKRPQQLSPSFPILLTSSISFSTLDQRYICLPHNTYLFYCYVPISCLFYLHKVSPVIILSLQHKIYIIDSYEKLNLIV